MPKRWTGLWTSECVFCVCNFVNNFVAEMVMFDFPSISLHAKTGEDQRNVCEGTGGGERSSWTVKVPQTVGTRAAGLKKASAGWGRFNLIRRPVKFSSTSEGQGCKGHCQSDEPWNCLKDNRFRKLLWKTGWSALYGFLRRGHTGLPLWRLNKHWTGPVRQSRMARYLCWWSWCGA